MPVLDSSEVQNLNAVEAKKRELRIRLARKRGEQDASATAAKLFSRINQDTQIQRQEIEAELLALEERGAVGVLDDWGEFTPVDKTGQDERKAGANAGLDWLATNPQAEQLAFIEAVGAGLVACTTAQGRACRVHSASGVVEVWLRSAMQRGLATDWASFRALLLATLDRAAALEHLG